MDERPPFPYYRNLLLWSVPALFFLYSFRQDIRELCQGTSAYADTTLSISRNDDISSSYFSASIPSTTSSASISLPQPSSTPSPQKDEGVDLFHAIIESISSHKDRTKERFVFV